ncbi:hypothetical protein B1690_08715 [Geobacillus sp. 46C-IIa]|nr:hypothetical protein B1690_08715 [Geobacillus sp. 46C-IIa]QNU28595.1 hypothetical protein IC803_03305 [Geobacillus sp. 46C-IIa]
MTKEELIQKIKNGFILENQEDMNDEDCEALKQTLKIVADTELLSVPPLLTVYDEIPTRTAWQKFMRISSTMRKTGLICLSSKKRTFCAFPFPTV